MATNILELLKEHLSGDVIANIANLIGEAPNNTGSALNAALPSLLSALVDQCGNSQGIDKIFNLLSEGNHDGGILSNLGALSLGGEETTKLISQGGSVLTTLFGDKVPDMTNLVASAGSLNQSASSSLLGFVTPVLLGLIGKRLKIENIDTPSGLAGFLDSQKGFLPRANSIESVSEVVAPKAAANESVMSGVDIVSLDDDVPSTIPEPPASFGSTLETVADKIEDVVDDTVTTTKDIAENIGETASQLGSTIVDEGKEFADSTVNAIEEGAGESQKLLPFVLLLAAIVLLWGLLKSCAAPDTTPKEASSPEASVPVATPEPAPAAEPVVAKPVEPGKVETPAAIKPTSDFFEKTLSTGYAIKSIKNGFESKFIGFIESSDPIDKELWFTTDGIQFDTNKATIRAESTQQIEHIAEILKAFPKVKIKIGGYTDNTGKANANVKLSNSRAVAVKNAIVGKDITADRVDAEGYGSVHPVASNDTEEGRQQNRRIDVKVTEK